ncbi:MULTISPECIES: hypothetical protein [unclassified Enterococcus]|uniref:hypothetical protein n=1 Tax=unclassified Enterococcus TaxID=2608891 RepID=UPI0015544216|nr:MULTISPECIES: hypothetical protein [unclassified Enterococcus]MBS7576535.1 hypothetical protein [Enterococcus sp. MMGLQ5-2]MBS7583978.1 hypothetical protein [Enterococcus sp. MMGLQ5-1]NPD11839.1 hypothetical protein [Enterococcus sp. MMGLQ5-1]NPD36372.1 hypothetical protein [Enterococcus sp. MMGLQ5-2]
MIIYGQLKSKQLYLDDKELSEKMWGIAIKEADGNLLLNTSPFDIDTNILSDPFDMYCLGLPKSGYDKRWAEVFIGNPDEKFYFEVPSWGKKNELEFYTIHTQVTTLDKRAFYIMVIEVMKQAGGKISEDDKETWITLEAFEAKHQDILSLSFDEANEISLKEAKTMTLIEERAPDSMTEAEYKYRGWDWDYEWFSEIYPDLKHKNNQ